MLCVNTQANGWLGSHQIQLLLLRFRIYFFALFKTKNKKNVQKTSHDPEQ